MARQYLLVSILAMGAVGCAPVTFDSASTLAQQSCVEMSADGGCSTGTGTPTIPTEIPEVPSEPTPPVDTSLKAVIHYLNEPTSAPAQYVNTQDVTLTLETKIPKPFQMILSADPKCQGTRQSFAPVVPVYSLPGSSGLHAVYVQVFSETANVVTACEMASVILDKNLPVIENVKVVIGKTAKDSVDVSFEGSDVDSGLVSLMCSTKVQDPLKKDCLSVLAPDSKRGSGVWAGVLPDGSHTLYVTAKDKAGNERKDFPIVIAKDTTAPVLTWVDTPMSEVTALPYELKFKYNDGPGGTPKAFQCLGANGTFVTCQVRAADATNNIFVLSHPFPAGSTVTDGPQVMGVKAQDQSDLWSNELKANFNLDRSQPTIKLDPIASYITSASLTAPFTASSLGSPYQFTSYTCELIQSGAVLKTQTTASSPCQFTGLVQNDPTKQYTLKVTGVKNSKTAQDQKSFSVDMTPPQLQIVKKASDPTGQSVSVFQVSAVDPQSGLKSLSCLFNRGTTNETKVNCADKVDFNSPALTDGLQKFEVFAEDQAGLKSSASYTWTIDLTAPADIRVTQPGTMTFNPRPPFEFVALDKNGQVDPTVDPATGYKCTVDSYSPMVACASIWSMPAAIANLADGSHKFYVQATDRSGNQSAVKVHDFLVDSTAPAVQIFPKVSDAIILDSTTIHFKVDENSTNITSVTCFVDSAPVTCNMTGLGTKAVVGQLTVGNPSPTNGVPRVVVVKAINQVSKEGSAQDTWNVHLGVNPLAKLKPALAVSQTQCVFCHTSMNADLITDNGASKIPSMAFQYSGNWGTSEWSGSDFEHGQWMSHRTALSSSIINGTIYYQNANYSANGAGNLGWWANLGMSAQTASEYGNKTIGRKFSSLPSSFNRLSDYLRLATQLRTVEEMNSLKSGVNAGFSLRLAMPTTTSSDPNQTKLQEVQALKIGAPTKAEIISKIPSGRDFYYIPDNPQSSPKEAELLLGLKKIAGVTPYYKVQGDLSCDGDLIINRSLFLKDLNLKTRRGCRIYTTGPIFIEAASNRTAPQAGIRFQDLSGEGLYNIQLSSASGISMGLGKCKYPVPDNGIAANICSLGHRAYDGFNTLNGSEIFYVATTHIVDANGNTLLEDASYNPNATSADFLTWQQDSTGKFVTVVKRQVSFQRILINAPMIHSRYSGDFKGSIVANFLMPSVGSFSYTYDPVFQDTRVKVLPILDLKNILYFQ